jgi:hypothetical protein
MAADRGNEGSATFSRKLLVRNDRRARLPIKRQSENLFKFRGERGFS